MFCYISTVWTKTKTAYSVPITVLGITVNIQRLVSSEWFYMHEEQYVFKVQFWEKNTWEWHKGRVVLFPSPLLTTIENYMETTEVIASR